MAVRRLAHTIVRGFSQLAAFPVSLMGLGLFRSWITLLTDGGIMAGLSGPVHDVALSFILIVLALAAGRVVALFQCRWAIVSCLAVAIGASALSIVGGAVGTEHVWTGTVVAVTVAYASALFILMWCDLYSRLDASRGALALACAMLLAEIVNFLLAGMVASYRLGALVVLPCLSMIALLRARTHVPNASAQTHGCTDKTRVATYVPWNLVALVGIYQFTSELCLSLTAAPIGLYAGVANVLAAGSVIICILFFSERFDLATVCKSPAVLLVPCLLLLPFAGGTHGAAAGAGAALSSSLFGLLVFLVICDIARAQGVSAVFLFGVEEATAGVGALGTALGEHREAFEALGISTPAVMAAFVALTVVAGLTLFDSEKIAKRWGVHIFGRGMLVESSLEREEVVAACDALAVERALTAREREVLALLAEGRTVNEMCAALGVARGTVKAHCEHIYIKVGVRSKKELLGLLGHR